MTQICLFNHTEDVKLENSHTHLQTSPGSPVTKRPRFYCPTGKKEKEKFDEFTAHMWCQLEKALAYVPKKWHRKPYTFGTLFGFVMEKAQYAMHLLYNEKKK